MADTNDRDHKRDLTNIRPDLVSLVDLGANGEPFFVMKRSPEGGSMATEDKIRKQEDEDKPEGEPKNALPGDVRSEMSALIKALADQTTGLIFALKEMATVDEGEVPTPPVVASKIMSIHNSLSSMLDKACGEEHEDKSIKSMLKSSNEFADATMITSSRDKMVAVLSSVAERLASVVDALASEDAEDPSEPLMAILQDIVSLTEQFPPASEDEDEEDPPEDEEEDEEMTASRLARLRKASSRLTELAQSFAEVSVEFAKALEEEESEGEDMADEDKKKGDGEAPVEKNADTPDPMVAAIDGLKKAFDDGIGEVKKSVEDLTKRIDTTDEKVEKMSRSRAPADGGGPDESVKKNEGDGGGEGGGESLFGDIMPENLRGTVNHT